MIATVKQEFERFNEMLDYVEKSVSSISEIVLLFLEDFLLLFSIYRQVPIPMESLDILWDQVLKCASQTFVEGYAC